MSSGRPESSLWGNVITSAEIALQVYEIIAEYKKGIVIQKEQAEKLLSPKAIVLGEEKDGYLHYEDEQKSMIPAYELLQKNVVTDPEFKEKYGSPEQIEKEGRFFSPEYFGVLEPPLTSPWGEVTQSTVLHNGVGIFQSEERSAFAVHQTISDLFLSGMAQQQAVVEGNYLFYTFDSNCAIPIYELSASHPQVLALISDEDSLVHTLCEDFPEYVDFHNRHVEEWGFIQDVSAPKGLFLQMQWEQEQGYILPPQGNAMEYVLPFDEEAHMEEFFEPSGEFEL